MIPEEQNALKVTTSVSPEIAQEFTRIKRLSESGKHAEAWHAANALYSKYPGEAAPNLIIAIILVENRQKSKALAYAEAAVKFAPDNAFNHAFLGKLYVDLGMIEFASGVLHKAFSLDKTQYRAPWALALYYFGSGDGRRALPYFDQALDAAPIQFTDSIRIDRAICLLSLGRVAEAEPDLTPALSIQKYRVNALTEIALLRKNDQTSGYAEQIRMELEKPELTEENRSDLFLCLGRLHENGRDYDNAFLNFTRSRMLLHSKFDMNKFLLSIEQSEAILTREVFERFRTFGHESEKPVFIVGLPRSGTTMTEQIIAAHSHAEGVGELVRMLRMCANFSNPGGPRQMLDRMTEAGPGRWKDVPQQYLNLLDALAPGAKRTVDKMPSNFRILGFIHLCFPNARIIHCKRNPLDNFVSIFQNKMNATHGYSYDQVTYGEYYKHYLRSMEHWKTVLAGSIYEIQYESMTANPEPEIRKMLDFLGLPWEDGCLNFNEREATVKTFSRLQVRNPINTGSVARWRNYESHLAPLISVLKRSGIGF